MGHEAIFLSKRRHYPVHEVYWALMTRR